MIFAINTLPMGINNYVYLKAEGVKFHSSLAFIANIASKSNKTITLFFDGNGRGEEYGSWYWKYFARYLDEIYNVKNFDIKSKEPNAKTLYNKPKLWLYNPNSPLSIYNNDKVDLPTSGDFIILHNSTNKMVDSAYLKQMQHSYQLLFKSTAFSFPYIGLKPLIKQLFHHSQTLSSATLNNQNIFKLPTHDYIYQVR